MSSNNYNYPIVNEPIKKIKIIYYKIMELLCSVQVEEYHLNRYN